MRGKNVKMWKCIKGISKRIGRGKEKKTRAKSKSWAKERANPQSNEGHEGRMGD